MPSETRLIIKGGTIVNHDYITQSDILIENGIITKIDQNITDEEAEVINAEGNYVFPGGVDAETYLNAERGGVTSDENYATGTKAAIFGGTTTIVNHVEVTADESVRERAEKEFGAVEASAELWCDVALQICVPELATDTRRQELLELVQQRPGIVPAVRLSTVGKGSHLVAVLDDGELYEALCWCRNHQILPSVIAESDALIRVLERDLLAAGVTGPEAHYLSRNERVEEMAVQRVLTVARLAHCPVHISRVYSAGSIEPLSLELPQQPPVVCGTHLLPLVRSAEDSLLSAGVNWAEAAACVTVPALKQDHTAALRALLARGHIHHVSSGHTVFRTEHRAAGGQADFRLITPGTAAAVQARMPLLWSFAVESGDMELTRFVEVTSSMPARLCGLYPQKGRVAVGADADLVIWSITGLRPAPPHPELYSVNPFPIGGDGGPVIVLLAGRIVFECGAAKPGSRGRLVGGSGQSSVAAWFRQAAILQAGESADSQPVQRAPYDGPVEDRNSAPQDRCVLYSDMVDAGVYQRETDEPIKEALPPGQRIVRTSVRTAQPPGGSVSAQSNWWG